VTVVSIATADVGRVKTRGQLVDRRRSIRLCNEMVKSTALVDRHDIFGVVVMSLLEIPSFR